MKNIVYFDLETQKSAEEVGGWDKIGQMGMSVGVTYSTTRGSYSIYGEKQVDDLIRELQRADLVVGFNNLRFDYEVLHGYTTLDLRQLPTLDMLVVLQNQLQHRLSLDSIATATFGVEKTADGMQAIHWFKDTPSSLASRWAAFLTERGSFKGYVALLMISPNLHFLEQISRMHHRNSKALGDPRKICHVVRDQYICSPIDGRFEDHLVVGVRPLGSPLEVEFDRLDQGCEFRQKFIDCFWSQAMGQLLLWTF